MEPNQTKPNRTLTKRNKTESNTARPDPTQAQVICNHVADPRIVLKPNAGSDRSWVWNAFDFTEGELEEITFALRLGNSDSANEFKKVSGCCRSYRVRYRCFDAVTGATMGVKGVEFFVPDTKSGGRGGAPYPTN